MPIAPACLHILFLLLSPYRLIVVVIFSCCCCPWLIVVVFFLPLAQLVFCFLFLALNCTMPLFPFSLLLFIMPMPQCHSPNATLGTLLSRCHSLEVLFILSSCHCPELEFFNFLQCHFLDNGNLVLPVGQHKHRTCLHHAAHDASIVPEKPTIKQCSGREFQVPGNR